MAWEVIGGDLTYPEGSGGLPRVDLKEGEHSLGQSMKAKHHWDGRGSFVLNDPFVVFRNYIDMTVKIMKKKV